MTIAPLTCRHHRGHDARRPLVGSAAQHRPPRPYRVDQRQQGPCATASFGRSPWVLLLMSLVFHPHLHLMIGRKGAAGQRDGDGIRRLKALQGYSYSPRSSSLVVLVSINRRVWLSSAQYHFLSAKPERSSRPAWRASDQLVTCSCSSPGSLGWGIPTSLVTCPRMSSAAYVVVLGAGGNQHHLGRPRFRCPVVLIPAEAVPATDAAPPDYPWLQPCGRT